uniref:activated RNA polymerase II transcriptional coactivator p15-like n=1 Tax=Styela clava TaxID=7725 RepID=UPI00193952E2|nr:activated RNA polymerase II transcriptional coactivator p15-like [Styela clava]
MSGKGGALSDSSDSENEKKIKAKLRKEQKKSATKRKQADTAAPEAKRPAGNSRQQDGNKEEKLSIGKMKFVTVREFKNKIYVDIREHYEKDGELLPGRKGVSLPAEQWQNLKSLIDDIDEKIQQMC